MIFDSKMRGMFILVIALALSLCIPALSYADADRVFKENAWAVVVVGENRTLLSLLSFFK